MSDSSENSESNEPGSSPKPDSSGEARALSIVATLIGIVVAIVSGLQEIREEAQERPAFKPVFPRAAGPVNQDDLELRLAINPAGKHDLKTRFSAAFYIRMTERVNSGPLPAEGQPDSLGKQLDEYSAFAMKNGMKEDVELLKNLQAKWAERKKPTQPRPQ